MNRRVFFTGPLLAIAMAAGLQAADVARCPAALVYTGSCGTQVVDTRSNRCAALYKYPRFDAAYNTTGSRIESKCGCYYIFYEEQYPRWYWALAKHPSCCGRYQVWLIEKRGNQKHVELRYYARRMGVGAFYPAKSDTKAAIDGRRQ